MRLFSIKPKRSKITGRVAIAYWDRESLTYAVVSPKSGNVDVVATGTLNHSEHPSPLAALSKYLGEQQIPTQQLIVLLSRSDVDVLTLTLPKSDQAELPALVAAEVEHQLGESEVPPIVDFYVFSNSAVSGELQPSDLNSVLAFALPQARLDAILEEAHQAGFRLANVTFRQMAALRRGSSSDSVRGLTVSVQIYPGEVELALCDGSNPLLLRSVRINPDDLDRTAEQLLVEVQRCMTLVPPEFEEREKVWQVDTSTATGRQLAEALESKGTLSLQKADVRLDSDRVPPTSLAGAAQEALRDSFNVDFINPKRSPAPPNPWIRPTAWGVGGVAAAAILGWTLMGDVWSLQEEVGQLEAELADAKKLEAKLLEKSDQVQLVERWLGDQVDWLSVLNEISDRLPDGSNATVRRLNASTDGTQGVLDLSVQVAQPDDISILESRLRSVKYSVSSKRISQTPEASEYPWKFETRVTFPIEPPDWKSFAAPQSASVAGGGSP